MILAIHLTATEDIIAVGFGIAVVGGLYCWLQARAHEQKCFPKRSKPAAKQAEVAKLDDYRRKAS